MGTNLQYTCVLFQLDPYFAVALHYNEEAPNSVTGFKRTPVLESYAVVTCGTKNGYQKYICLKKIGICAINMITILGSIISKVRRTYMTT